MIFNVLADPWELDGLRVTVNNRSSLVWARGEKGTIKVPSDLSKFTNLMLNKKVNVKLDSFDSSRPPFGEFIFDWDDLDEVKEETSDPVNHPSHYTDGKYEVIDFIESHELYKNFYVANAIKYLSRAGKKNPDKKDEDIQKAIWYMERQKIFDPERIKLTIPVDEYIKDKGLDGTPQGVAIELIMKGNYDLAVKVLKMKE